MKRDAPRHVVRWSDIKARYRAHKEIPAIIYSFLDDSIEAGRKYYTTEEVSDTLQLLLGCPGSAHYRHLAIVHLCKFHHWDRERVGPGSWVYVRPDLSPAEREHIVRKAKERANKLTRIRQYIPDLKGMGFGKREEDLALAYQGFREQEKTTTIEFSAKHLTLLERCIRRAATELGVVRGFYWTP